MKIYDGPALIADKGDATVLPVRIDGVEFTPFSRLARRRRLRRRWFPKVTITLYAPRRLAIPAELRGRARRHRAGLALYDVMSDMMARRPDPPSLFGAAARGPRGAWRRPSDHGRPDRRPARPTTASIAAEPGARPAARAPHRARRGGRADAAELDRRRRRLSRAAGDRPRPGDAEPYGRHRRRAVGLPHRRAAPRRSPRAALSSWPSSTRLAAALAGTVEIVWLEDLRATARPCRQALRPRRAALSPPRGTAASASPPPTRPRSCSPRGRKARRKGSC